MYEKGDVYKRQGGDDLSQHLVAVLKIRSLKPKS